MASWYRRRRRAARARTATLLTELHRKVALDLCKNYDTILIPTFETSQMTKKHDPYKNTRRKIKLMS